MNSIKNCKILKIRPQICFFNLWFLVSIFVAASVHKENVCCLCKYVYMYYNTKLKGKIIIVKLWLNFSEQEWHGESNRAHNSTLQSLKWHTKEIHYQCSM